MACPSFIISSSAAGSRSIASTAMSDTLRESRSMMAVIFEVWSASERKDDYLKLAASLGAEVE